MGKNSEKWPHFLFIYFLTRYLQLCKELYLILKGIEWAFQKKFFLPTEAHNILIIVHKLACISENWPQNSDKKHFTSKWFVVTRKSWMLNCSLSYWQHLQKVWLKKNEYRIFQNLLLTCMSVNTEKRDPKRRFRLHLFTRPEDCKRFFLCRSKNLFPPDIFIATYSNIIPDIYSKEWSKFLKVKSGSTQHFIAVQTTCVFAGSHTQQHLDNSYLVSSLSFASWWSRILS